MTPCDDNVVFYNYFLGCHHYHNKEQNPLHYANDITVIMSLASPSKRTPNRGSSDPDELIFSNDFADISIGSVVSSGQPDYRKKMGLGCQQMSFVLRLFYPSWRTVPAGAPEVDVGPRSHPDWSTYHIVSHRGEYKSKFIYITKELSLCVHRLNCKICCQ